MKFEFNSDKGAVLIGALSGLLVGVVAMYPLVVDPPESDFKPTAVELVRPNIAWPTHVTLTKDQKVWVRKKGLLKGFVVINAGVTLEALDLKEDGSVVVIFADHTLEVPMKDTDLFARSLSPSSFDWAIKPEAPAKEGVSSNKF